jgi:hypothetical protein
MISNQKPYPGPPSWRRLERENSTGFSGDPYASIKTRSHNERVGDHCYRAFKETPRLYKD